MVIESPIVSHLGLILFPIENFLSGNQFLVVFLNLMI